MRISITGLRYQSARPKGRKVKNDWHIGIQIFTEEAYRSNTLGNILQSLSS